MTKKKLIKPEAFYNNRAWGNIDALYQGVPYEVIDISSLTGQLSRLCYFNWHKCRNKIC